MDVARVPDSNVNDCSITLFPVGGPFFGIIDCNITVFSWLIWLMSILKWMRDLCVNECRLIMCNMKPISHFVSDSLCTHGFPGWGVSGDEDRLVVVDAQNGLTLKWVKNEWVLLWGTKQRTERQPFLLTVLHVSLWTGASWWLFFQTSTQKLSDMFRKTSCDHHQHTILLLWIPYKKNK